MDSGPFTKSYPSHKSLIPLHGQCATFKCGCVKRNQSPNQAAPTRSIVDNTARTELIANRGPTSKPEGPVPRSEVIDMASCDFVGGLGWAFADRGAWAEFLTDVSWGNGMDIRPVTLAQPMDDQSLPFYDQRPQAKHQ